MSKNNDIMKGFDICDPSDPHILDEEEVEPPPTKKAKKQPSQLSNVPPKKTWTFTWNNYPADWADQMAARKGLLDGLMGGEEVGEKGTPHIQGWLEFKKKNRWSSLKLSSEIHWEKANGTPLQNSQYIHKGLQPKEEWEELGISGPNYGKDAKVTKWGTGIVEEPYKYVSDLVPRGWQLKLLDILEKKPDNRSVWWLWEPMGKCGKTSFQKHYLSLHEDCIVLSGKAADMKNAVLTYLKENKGKPPRVVFCNIPRSVEEKYVSFTGIEEIKDMLFYSGKYEGGMVNADPPHLIMFGNWEPMTYTLSGDRWNIVRLPDGQGDGLVQLHDWSAEQ